MRFEVVPILSMAREVYLMPRGMTRFHEYVRKMVGDAQGDISFVPMGTMNPMGREHVLAFVERLIAMDAERLVAEAAAEAQRRLPKPDASLKIGISVLDDIAGGWTHHELTEASLYFETTPALKRGWISVPVWASAPPDAARLREETLAATARAAWQLEHGVPRTLREAITQEGHAWRFAGRAPRLAPAQIEAARAKLAKHLDDARWATLFAGMYGDRAANEAGHAPLGLPERAGFEVAQSS